METNIIIGLLYALAALVAIRGMSAPSKRARVML
jgi:hypothetical protein